ncbi:MAG: aldehyde dehydrogenase, partial [Usitatibacter sp.]
MDTVTGKPREYANHIGGKSTPAADGRTFESVNPTTGKVWGRFAESGSADVDRAVRAAADAFDGPWGKLSPTRRGRLMMAWGDRIAESAETIASIETQQNGKLIAEMRAQAKVVKDWLYYYGGLADKIEGRVIPIERPSVLNYTLREPLGVIGVIVPWNSPTFLTIMSVAPALAAGNTIVLKPSEVTSASAFELARLAEEAGFPPGVVNVVTGGRQAGEALVDHERVAKISFTGSEAGGKAIASRAGARLAGVTLELGGKSPNIVFQDANLDQAEAGVLAGIFAAAGQTCVAGSRAFIHESIYDEMRERLVARARKIRLGDPLLAETQMGPVATKMQLQKDQQMIERAVGEGAQLLIGGGRAAVAGFADGLFFEPTILQNAGPANHIMNEEVFGPVLAMTPFRDDDEVVKFANATRFGLAAGVWTRDLARAHTMARRLQAGTVWINIYRALTFNSPFG